MNTIFFLILLFPLYIYSFLSQTFFPIRKDQLPKNGYFISYEDSSCFYEVRIAIFKREDDNNYYYNFYTVKFSFAAESGILCHSLNLKKLMQTVDLNIKSFDVISITSTVVPKTSFDQNTATVLVEETEYYLEGSVSPVFTGSKSQTMVFPEKQPSPEENPKLAQFFKLVLLLEVETGWLFPGIIRRENLVKESEKLLNREHPLSAKKPFTLELKDGVALFLFDSEERTELKKLVFHKNRDLLRITLTTYSFLVRKDGKNLSAEELLQQKDFSEMELVERKCSVTDTEIGLKAEPRFFLLTALHFDFFEVHLDGVSLSGFLRFDNYDLVQLGNKSNIYSKPPFAANKMIQEAEKRLKEESKPQGETPKQYGEELEACRNRFSELENAKNEEITVLQTQLVESEEKLNTLTASLEQEKSNLSKAYETLKESGDTNGENKYKTLLGELEKTKKMFQRAKTNLTKTKKLEKEKSFLLITFGVLFVIFLIVAYKYFTDHNGKNAYINSQTHSDKLKTWEIDDN